MIKTGANNLAAYLQMKFKTSKNMTVQERLAYAAVSSLQLASTTTAKTASRAPYPAVEKQVKDGIRQLQ